jgi:hypothetical protein
MTSHLCLGTAENCESFDFFVLGWGAASRGNRVSTFRRNALPLSLNVSKSWIQGSVSPRIKPGHVDPWRQRQCIVSKRLDSVVPWHTIIYQNTGSLTHTALKTPKHAFCENMLTCVLCHYCGKNLIHLGPCGLAWELGSLCSVIFSGRGATFPQHVWVSFTMGSGTLPTLCAVWPITVGNKCLADRCTCVTAAGGGMPLKR